MRIDVTKIMMLSSKLNTLLEEFDNNCLTKKVNLTIKDKILIFLAKQNLSSCDLVKLLGIAKTNMALNVKSLEDNGLLFKTRDSIDKRVFVLTLTEQGRILAEEKVNQINKNMRVFCRKRNIDKISTLIDELNRKIII